MGDIADMMLEGDLCAGCGVYLGGTGDGIPRYCSSDCYPEDTHQVFEEKEYCGICGKGCTGKQGLEAHQNSKHGGMRCFIYRAEKHHIKVVIAKSQTPPEKITAFDSNQNKEIVFERE